MHNSRPIFVVSTFQECTTQYFISPQKHTASTLRVATRNGFCPKIGSTLYQISWYARQFSRSN